MTPSNLSDRTTITDPAGVTRSTLTDAAGRVTSVTEAGTLITSYAYDALNDLTIVCQGSAFVNGACPSGVQSRTFAYDSLARLITATNPESGTTPYTYDNDGNLLTKTDANTNKTTMTYDALNRVASKAYAFISGYSTPNVTYCYDGNTQAACADAPSGSESNLIGHLTLVSSSASSTAYGQYSVLGNVMQSTQITAGRSYPFSYTYNLANAMTQTTLPSGRTVTWIYDSANRIGSAGGTPPGGAAKSYASAISYAAQGPISQFTLGNGLVEVRSYDTYRQQPIGATLGVNAGDSSRLKLGFNYCASGAYSCTNNNGNLQSQTITLLGATQTYGYDGYNRLTQATEKTGATTNWSENFNYDSFGNRWVSPNPVGISLSAWTVTANYYNSSTNRLTFNNFGYDNAGNQTTISPYAVSYDVENRQTGFTSTSNGSATYTYDGDGRRVTKTTGGVTTTYVYDAGGNLAAEYSSQPPTMPCQTCYLTTDHLGSTRVITDQNGNAVSRHDFLPFGEELVTSNRTAALDYGVTDNVMHRYTGQQRDLEGPGLDFFHARYFQGAQGRFASPDPGNAGSDRRDPQSWNGYAYVRNRALVSTDPDGRMLQRRGDLWTGGGGVTVDGVASVITGNLGGNALAQCPANVCSGWLADGAGRIAYSQFVAGADGSRLWRAVGSWFADPAEPLNQINEAFRLAAKYGTQTIDPAALMKVLVRYVGSTYNVQILYDELNAERAAQDGYKDPVAFMHNGFASYYMGLPNLVGIDAGHVVAADKGVEAHYDSFGPYNPLHELLEVLPSLFINTRGSAIAIPYTCSLTGGCHQ
jgi:RHS repeat-associated protein